MNGFESLRAFVQRTHKQRKTWDTVPQKSKIMLLTMVFCLFAAIGVISQLQSATASLAKLWVAALISGVFAVSYAWVSIQKTWLWILLLLPLQALLSSSILRYVGGHSSPAPGIPDAIQPWLQTACTATILLIAGSYVLTMNFIAREGDRFFRTHTEMQLAGEIHRLLVTNIERTSGEYEFYGTSVASGEVGGDLVDVIERDGYWVAYVADVAGHGVSSGVLMAMIKSATNMSARYDPGANGLLEGLNEVLCSLKTGNMFATFGMLAFSPNHGLRYSLAGHLPILLSRGGEVQFLGAQNMPVGVFSDTVFESTKLDVLPGDVLAIITDGLTEVFDKSGEEFGIEAIAAILGKSNGLPLKDIASDILQQAARHGPRSDDQSLLLVRKAG